MGCILFKGEVGQIYNIGGTNEVANVDVARSLIKIMDLEDKMETLITYVPDRAFNDLRYTINSTKLAQLGWKEEVPFEQGLGLTVEWYLKNPGQHIQPHPSACAWNIKVSPRFQAG